MRFVAQTVPGKGRGRALGFPTLNLRIPPGLSLTYGIYACWVRIHTEVLAGALHYGPVPVFGEESPSLEVHLIDAQLPSAPPEVEIEVVRFLRPVRTFDSPQALAAQIAEDVAQARAVLEADRGVQRVREALTGFGLEPRILRFPEGTRTAREAARAVGTTLGQIVKSLVFLADSRPVLVLVGGAHRVSASKLARLTGAQEVHPADPATVERITGFPVGAVPPVGHATPLTVYMDEALLQHPVVYTGGGGPDALVEISPEDLRRITQAQVVDLKQD